MGRNARAVVAVAMLIGFAVRPTLGQDRAAAVAGELAQLQGTWQLISARTDGVDAPADRVKFIQVTIRGNAHTVRFGDQIIAREVPFEIDPTTTPKSTTDTLNEGEHKGQPIRGIYRLEGDVLTSCVAGVGKDRPKEFAAEVGSGQTLRVFRRLTEKGDR